MAPQAVQRDRDLADVEFSESTRFLQDRGDLRVRGCSAAFSLGCR
jgi:hypothetical protein